MLVISFYKRFLPILLGCFGALYGQQGSVMLSTESNYQKAKELYEAGQYAVAQPLFDKVSAREEGVTAEQIADAHYLAARCAIALFNGDSQKRVDQFAEEHPFNPNLNRLYLHYANYRFGVKRYRDAAEYYAKIKPYRLEPEEQAEYQFKLGYAYLQRNKIEEAKSHFSELKDGNSTYANSARYYYGHLLYADSSFQEASKTFESLRSDKKFGPMVPYYLAHIYYGMQNYPKVIAEGKDLVNTASEERATEMARLVADAYYYQKNYAEAAQYLELYKEKGGIMLLKNYYQLGYALYKTQRYAEALESFNKITRGPDELKQKAYYQLADCYLKTGTKSKAMTAFKAASEIDELPEIKEDAYYNYAKLAYELADPYQDAIVTLQNYLKAYPQSAHRDEINNYLTNLYITTRDYERALKAIEATGLARPQLRATYQKIAFYRAGELYSNRHYEQALQKLEASLQFPVNARYRALALYWKGENFYQLGAFQNALQAYKNFRGVGGAINLKEFDRSFYQTGYCFFKLLDFQNAATDFRTFVKNSSSKNDARRLADAYLRLGDAYLITGGYLKSIDYYDQAILQNTAQSDYAFFQKAECLGLDGKKESKINQLQKLIRQFPKSEYAKEARFEMGETYLQLDQYDKALLSYQNYLNRFPNSTKAAAAHLKIGLIYANTDQSNKALKVYKGVVRDYTGSKSAKEAVNLAGIVYKQQNRVEEYLDWVKELEFMNFGESELDSTAYNTALELYAGGQYNKAATAFDSYLNRYPEGLFRLDAHYYLADCALNLQQNNKAARQFEAIMELAPNEHEEAAVRYLAKLRYEQDDYAQAQRLYKRWLELSQSRDGKLQAQAGIMRSAFAAEQNAEALLYAELILAKPGSGKQFRIEAQKIAALSYYKKEQEGEAMRAFDQLTRLSSGEERAMGLYYQAELHHEQAHYDTTKVLIDSLIQTMTSYKDWKMKALYLLARNFWAQDDIFQAKYTLDFIIKANHTAELTQKAHNLRAEIEEAESAALQRKKNKMREQRQKIAIPEDGDIFPSDTLNPIDTTR